MEQPVGLGVAQPSTPSLAPEYWEIVSRLHYSLQLSPEHARNTPCSPYEPLVRWANSLRAVGAAGLARHTTSKQYWRDPWAHWEEWVLIGEEGCSRLLREYQPVIRELPTVPRWREIPLEQTLLDLEMLYCISLEDDDDGWVSRLRLDILLPEGTLLRDLIHPSLTGWQGLVERTTTPLWRDALYHCLRRSYTGYPDWCHAAIDCTWMTRITRADRDSILSDPRGYTQISPLALSPYSDSRGRAIPLNLRCTPVGVMISLASLETALDIKDLVKLIGEADGGGSDQAREYRDVPVQMIEDEPFVTLEISLRIVRHMRGISLRRWKKWIERHLPSEHPMPILAEKKAVPDIPCVYLISLGSVRELQEVYSFADDTPSHYTICKYGRTVTLSGRLQNHRRKYGSIMGPPVELVTYQKLATERLVEAEAIVRTYANTEELLHSRAGERELLLLSPEQLTDLIQLYEELPRLFSEN